MGRGQGWVCTMRVSLTHLDGSACGRVVAAGALALDIPCFGDGCVGVDSGGRSRPVRYRRKLGVCTVRTLQSFSRSACEQVENNGVCLSYG